MRKIKEYYLPILITLIGGFLIFYQLGEVALIEWDESIYAKIAKNVVASGNWLDFRWFPQSENPWFEKPPVYIWSTAISYIVFGISEFAARFTSALLGTLGIFVTYLFGKELFSRKVGLISSIVLASTIHWVFQSRNGTMDVAVGFFMLLSLYYFWKAQLQSKEKKWWFLTGVGLGLTLMTKGVIFIIPVIVMSIYVLIDVYYLKAPRKKYFWNSILLLTFAFLLITLPWHLIMLIRHGGDFWNNYFGYHVLARTKGIEGHANPLFWYRVVIRHWFKHWYIVLLAALPTLLFRIYKNLNKSVRDGSASGREELFLIIWAGVTFVVFSASVSKIQWYIIPIYPALTLINGRFLQVLADYVFNQESLRKFKDKLWQLSFGALFISIPVFMLVIPDFREQWKISNYLKGLKAACLHMKDISTPEDILYTYELAPGPTLFYSDRVTNSIGKGQIISFLKDNDSIYVVMREDMFNNHFIEEPEIMLFSEILFNENGYILLGKK